MRPLVVVARPRAMADRLAPIFAAASGGAPLRVAERLEEALHGLVPSPSLFAVDAEDLEASLSVVRDQHPSSRVIAWTSEPTGPLLGQALREPRVAAVLGWPAHRTTPRAWEIAYATRRVVQPDAEGPRLAELLRWGGSSVRFTPQTTADRDRLVEAMPALAARWSVGERVGERMADAVHELLTNAMYDAPVDPDGRPLYAMDRRQEVRLTGRDAPVMRVCCDGQHVAIEVTDRFGLLDRRRLLSVLVRGLLASGDTLDTSHGGAGLGLLRLYRSAAALLVEATYGQRTRVTWVHDLDVPIRQQRGLPTSVHFFEPTPAALGGGAHG